MAQDRGRTLRIWLFPLSILLVITLTVFWAAFAIDAHGDLGHLALIFRPNPASAEATIQNSGQVLSGVLGIAITVVAIVVELAANRYTHRITELFVHEPVNFIVMGYFVVSALVSLLNGLLFDVHDGGVGSFIPYAGVMVSNAMLGFSLLILLPYFAFVFDFLGPIQILDRIRETTMRVVSRTTPSTIDAAHAEAIRGIEQLADVGLNAMEHKDKGVSMASVDALRQMVIDYETMRQSLPEAWFRVDGELAHNPDFVSMSSTVLDAVTGRRIWFEMKVLRKYQTIYNEALNKMRDINYVIAINTRLIAEAALEHGHDELFDLSLKFFNTYLRATLNARDVRTAYNVLHQYRLLADRALAYDDGRRAIEIAKYFKYYGLLAFNMNLPFILETAAYDLCALNERAFDAASPASRELLKIFLQVDKESESAAQENSLRGVRKAQVKLATYYLVRGDEALARFVFRDMEHEQVARLASIRDELLHVTSSEFWEISDRGENFDYLAPDRKKMMLKFFGWFPSLAAPRGSALPDDLRDSEPASIPMAPAQVAQTSNPPVAEVLPTSAADPRSEPPPPLEELARQLEAEEQRAASAPVAPKA